MGEGLYWKTEARMGEKPSKVTKVSSDSSYFLPKDKKEVLNKKSGTFSEIQNSSKNMWRRHTISTLIFQRSVCYCFWNKTSWEQFIWFSTSSYSCCCSSYQKTFYPIFLFFFWWETKSKHMFSFTRIRFNGCNTISNGFTMDY